MSDLDKTNCQWSLIPSNLERTDCQKILIVGDLDRTTCQGTLILPNLDCVQPLDIFKGIGTRKWIKKTHLLTLGMAGDRFEKER